MEVVLQDKTAMITFPFPLPPEKDEIKRLGARWLPTEKKWSLSLNIPNIRWLLEHGVDVPDDIKNPFIESIESSRAAEQPASTADLVVPDGLSYRPFQQAGITWALNHPSTLIGDDMGLGKTIQALGVINSDDSIHSALIVCPLSVARNWQNEASKWLARPLSAQVASSTELPDSDLVIIHWGILAKHKETIRERQWDLVVLDEAHYAKNVKASRTQAIVGSKKDNLAPLEAKRKLALTGTPIPNRPIEMFPVLKWLDPSEFGNWLKYVTRYCNGQQTPYGWDVSGASNLEDLQTLLRSTIMIRRLKTAVLTDLPPKTRQIIELSANTAQLKKALSVESDIESTTSRAIIKARSEVEIAKASDDESEYHEAVKRLHLAQQLAFTELSQARHGTAIAKIPFVQSHLQDLLSGNDNKVVVFCHHRDVLESLRKGLEVSTAEWSGVKTTSIMGGDDSMSRQSAVDSFQRDPQVRVFLGTIGAAREGITLTAANVAVFAEIDWVPGNMSQAEDRIYRIGQNDAVTIQHLLLEGSIDAKMIKTVISKQEVIDAALDISSSQPLFPDRVEQPEADPDIAVASEVAMPLHEVATASVKRNDIALYAERITQDEIQAVYEGLQLLAAMDGDHAQDLNGWGFSKVDVAIGHQLSNLAMLTPKQAALGAKLLVKYHRQVGTEVAHIWGDLKNRECIPVPDMAV